MVVQDQAMIFAYLHGMEALANLREPALRALCSSVRYEWHDANEIIYWSVYNYIFFFSPFFPVSDSVRKIWSILDSELSMKKHVTKICQTAYFKLKHISSIPRFLTEDATEALVTSYILWWLECNCLLMGTQPVLSSNLSKKFRTLLQDSTSWHLVIITLHLASKSCTGFPFQSALNTMLHACASML